MKSVELLKFSERQSLVQIFKENGEHKEYVVCSNYNPDAPEGSKWDWGHYFITMEGALTYIATECFTPIHKYVLIETDTSNNINQRVFNTYGEAKRRFDELYEQYKSDQDCCHAEITDDGNGNTVGEIWFMENSMENFNEDIKLKIIDVVV